MADGIGISIWADLWLNYARNFYVQTPHLLDFSNLEVSKLMVPWTMAWNRKLIKYIFGVDDIIKVLRTSISPLGSMNKSVAFLKRWKILC